VRYQCTFCGVGKQRLWRPSMCAEPLLCSVCLERQVGPLLSRPGPEYSHDRHRHGEWVPARPRDGWWWGHGHGPMRGWFDLPIRPVLDSSMPRDAVRAESRRILGTACIECLEPTLQVGDDTGLMHWGTVAVFRVTGGVVLGMLCPVCTLLAQADGYLVCGVARQVRF
jgi:hypothetical protein